jgi:hypothetical protein
MVPGLRILLPLALAARPLALARYPFPAPPPLHATDHVMNHGDNPGPCSMVQHFSTLPKAVYYKAMRECYAIESMPVYEKAKKKKESEEFLMNMIRQTMERKIRNRTKPEKNHMSIAQQAIIDQGYLMHL